MHLSRWEPSVATESINCGHDRLHLVYGNDVGFVVCIPYAYLVYAYLKSAFWFFILCEAM